MTKNRPMMLGIGLLVVAVIAAAVVGVVLVNQSNQTTSTDLTALNPAQPELATQILNNKIGEVLVAAQSGDPQAFTELFSEIGDVTSGEFTLSAFISDDSGDLELEMDGRFQSGDTAADSAFEGTLSISGVIPDLTPILTPFEIEMVVLAETMYVNLHNIPADFGEILVFLGITEDKWYSMPLDSDTGELAQTFTGNDFSEEDLAELEQNLEQYPPFINGRTTADRVVGGTTLQCMLTEINPESESNTSAEELPPVEICTRQGNLLPFFFGMGMQEDGTNTRIELVINSLNEAANITAPQGAQDLEALFNAFGAGL